MSGCCRVLEPAMMKSAASWRHSDATRAARHQEVRSTPQKVGVCVVKVFRINMGANEWPRCASKRCPLFVERTLQLSCVAGGQDVPGTFV